ncbi:hypothetical protein BJ138DRAFT_1119475 [Hygrophoropsis aurantiaca]|uniref:Uncharacterized protein n=1 Tax=Hygrophoropsis aurantiaca TaxID=72124 RepID=A0ACB7ZTH1_9AGAM|nr:hypothetical protein BJ138DRAFT_1119475 [Hygrophoropsis aurantiaca]
MYPHLYWGYLLDRVDMVQQAQALTDTKLPDQPIVLIQVILSHARLTGKAELAMMLSNKRTTELREFYGIALASKNPRDELPNEDDLPSPEVYAKLKEILGRTQEPKWHRGRQD